MSFDSLCKNQLTFNRLLGNLVKLYCHGVESEASMAVFIELLQTQHYLRILEIQAFSLVDGNVELLCNHIKQNTSILCLCIDECKLSGSELVAIGNMLAVNSTIRYLEITNNYDKFTVDDFIHFIELIKDNGTLEIMEVDQKFCSHSKVKRCV